MVRDTAQRASVVKAGLSKSAVKEQELALRRSKRSKFTPASTHSKGNPIHRALKYHEKKLLRKHDFMQYPQDNWHEPFCITKYHLEDREDYRRYLRLVGLTRQLLAHLRYLPSDSKIRIQITQQLMEKLFTMGLIREKLGLAEVDKVGVETFCRRRLSTVIRDLSMAANCKLAAELIHHGHVRVGTTQVRDPAFLVSKGLEDLVTWMPGSKIKHHVDNFNVQRDDYE
ncbi:hypothetical protein C4B63_17g46 [Trypanosoma cruzi]|uniref:Small ribosomal subunit protein uS4 N-terminal domain-containing protein n=1 Tax=Trypanosoma cruzi TaxID=5693 RepID=A0A2V2VND3_TRYCR|nr:hypothetical protein C4B63_17g46 [Trypanosoma cruzi]